MKRIQIQLFILLLAFQLVPAQLTTPFHRGVNLSNWFQGKTVHDVDFLRYTYEDFEDIKSLGVDVIRLPVNFHGMSSGSPDYILDPILLDFLDQIVDITEALDIHLVFDNHSFDDGGPTTSAVFTPLSKIWPQLATHFLDRDSTLYFEIKNEPWDISDLVWDTIQQNIVNSVRAIDPKRTMIVGPTSWNSYNNLASMLNYTDDNLIYTFHFYDPFVFTHQGASWPSPSLEPLSGVPFPYGASPMPQVPPELVGTWIASNLAGYATTGTAEHMRSLIDIAADFRTARSVPIYCGEFGAYMRYADPHHRVEWYKATTEYLDSLDIGWTMWDYHGGFGLFEPHSYGMFDHDLNIPLVSAIGFIEPDQTPYVKTPDTENFFIYYDHIGKNITPDFETDGTVILYDDTDPVNGDYHMSWAGASQYDRLSFDFIPDRDLSLSTSTNRLILTLSVKGSGTPVNFDIRFLDTKTDVPEDHPWRMTKTITGADLIWDGTWHLLFIPLDEMVETGSWDGTWLDPIGKFDWTDIDRLEIVAEHGNFGDAVLAFDTIQLDWLHVDSIDGENDILTSFRLNQNYPNPFNPSTTIQFMLPESAITNLILYDVNGRVVETLVAGIMEAGSHSITWRAEDLETGVYFARIEAGAHSDVIKLLLLK